MHAGGWCCMHVPACIMTLCERLLWDLLMWGKKHQCEGVRDKNRICLSGFLSVAVKLPLLMWQCLYYNWGWRACSLRLHSLQQQSAWCLKGRLSFLLQKNPTVAQCVICEQTEPRESSKVRGHDVPSWILSSSQNSESKHARKLFFEMGHWFDRITHLKMSHLPPKNQ